MALCSPRAVATRRSLVAALCATLLGCAGQPASAVRARPVNQIYTDDAAFTLAQRLLLAFGYDHLRQVAQLNFRQVYYLGEDPIFSTAHHWDLVNQRDRMVWTSADGHTYDAVLHLQTGLAYGYVDGEEAVGPEQTALTTLAQRRFAADTHYLVLPMRLLDPSAHLVLSGAERVDGRTFEVLELLPEAPEGPTVRLFVDPTGLRVLRSEVAANDDPRTHRIARWGQYRPAGPLLLAHEVRLDDAGDRRTMLQDVSVLREVDHTALLPKLAR